MSEQRQSLYAGRPNNFDTVYVYTLSREGNTITVAVHKDIGVDEGNAHRTITLGEQVDFGGNLWQLIELPKTEHDDAEERPGGRQVTAVFQRLSNDI